MGRIPIKHPREVIKALARVGYQIARQKGSHIRLVNYNNPQRRPLTIPNHQIVKPGLLAKIIRDAGLTIDEFIELLKQ